MAKEHETVKTESGSKATPLIIIGLVFLTMIISIWVVMQSGDKDKAVATNKNTASNNNAAATQQATNNYANAPAGATPEQFKGSPNASVILEEFADFQCGACAVKHSVFNEINSHYGSKIKFVFRNFPLVQAHPKAYDAAVATEAAGFQGKFWEMQNLLFANQQKWSAEPNHRKTFEEYAKTIGLDVDKFTTDSLGLNAKNRVDADMRRGIAVNVRSTPSLYINGKPVPFEQMTVENLKTVVDAELERVSPKKDETESSNSNSKSDDADSEKSEKKEDKKADSDESSEKKDDSK